MSYNEAETRFYLIDPVLRGKGYNKHWKLKLETPAPVESTGGKGRRRPGSGLTDYLLCVQVGNIPKPLSVAVIKAKAETDRALPATLVGDWPKQDGHEGKPFPTFARLISQRGLPEAESDFSWTVDFTARRAKAREDVAPHLAEVEKGINEAVAFKGKIATLKRAKASEANMNLAVKSLRWKWESILWWSIENKATTVSSSRRF